MSDTANEACLIDWGTREVVKPDGFAPVGVESDELVNPIRFEAPRFYRGCDISEFSFRVNYQNAQGDDDVYLVDDLEVQDETIAFTWRLSRLATVASGIGTFVVCGVKLADDGETVLQEINSTVATYDVLEGFEVGDASEFAVRLDWLNAIVEPMVEAEALRVANEEARVENEIERIASEEMRVEAESERTSAEAARKATFADIVATLSEAKVLVLTDEQYDDEGRPTIEGTPGIVYFVPVDASNDDNDGYIEWAYLDGEWERMGTTQANLKAVSADVIDELAADGEVPEGNEVVTQSGLKLLWAKIKARFAAKVHEHDASDITSGTFGSERLGKKSVTSDKFADNSVTQSALSDKSVSPAKLSDELNKAVYKDTGKKNLINSGNAWYRRIGRMVEVSVSITNTDNITATSSGVQIGTLPAGYRPPVQIDVGSTAKGNGTGQLSILPNGTVRIYCFSSNSQYYGSHAMYFTDNAFPS